MRRRALTAAALIGLAAMVVMEGDAWARARGGGGGAGRGSRSYSAPAPPSNPAAPNRSYSQPTQPAAPAAPAAPQRRGFFGGLMGGIAGFMLGGLLGSLLFGGFGHGFGGIGLLDLLLIGGGIALLIMFLRRRQAAAPTLATAGGYGSPGGASSEYGFGGSAYGGVSTPAGGGGTTATATPSAPVETDRDRGVAHIQQMDPTFDPAQFGATASATFMRVQTAWSAGDIAAVRDILTPEMATEMQGQADHLRAERRVNRIEQVEIRRAEVTEAWQETGQDFVTVFFSASMLDYTLDQRGDVVEGSRAEPVRVEEYWTFTRPVGRNRWKLSAIQPSS
jgi:predicted lipid-binding transport protein (Tim44 family)